MLGRTEVTRFVGWLSLVAACGPAVEEGSRAVEAVEAPSVLEIWAAATPIQGRHPSMRVRLAGEVVAELSDVRGDPSQRSFLRFELTLPRRARASEIEVGLVEDWYIDPANDWNLVVDRIALDGVVYEAEAPGTYSTGTWTSDTGCAPGYKRSEWMNCAGSFRFAEPPVETVFTRPACPAIPASGIPAGVRCSDADIERSRLEAGIFDRVVASIEDTRRIKLEHPERDVSITVAFMHWSEGLYYAPLCRAAAAGVRIVGVFDQQNQGALAAMLDDDPACGPDRVVIHTLGGHTASVDEWQIFHVKVMLFETGEPEVRLIFGSPNLYPGGMSTWFETWNFARLPATSHFVESHRCALGAIVSDAEDSAPEEGFAARVRECVASIDAAPDPRLQVFFSPDPARAGLTALLGAIRGAERTVDVASYLLSSGALARQIAAAASQESVRTRLLFDNALHYVGPEDGPLTATRSAFLRWLRPSGAETRFLETRPWQLMHHKFVVIDDRRVFLGGGHFTAAAFSNNYESFWFFDDPELTEPFTREFQRLWSLARREQDLPAAGH